jgi:hypothetical protein
MLLPAYLAELVMSSLTINPSGTATAVGRSIFCGLDSDIATGFLLKQQPRKILAKAQEVLFKLHAILMIEEMQRAMHTPKRSDPTGRDVQLRSGVRTGGPTLQRQQTNDDLQAINQPMLTLPRQHVVPLQELGFLTTPGLFPRASCVQLGRQRIIPPRPPHGLSRTLPRKLK